MEMFELTYEYMRKTDIINMRMIASKSNVAIYLHIYIFIFEKKLMNGNYLRPRNEKTKNQDKLKLQIELFMRKYTRMYFLSKLCQTNICGIFVCFAISLYKEID